MKKTFFCFLIISAISSSLSAAVPGKIHVNGTQFEACGQSIRVNGCNTPRDNHYGFVLGADAFTQRINPAHTRTFTSIITPVFSANPAPMSFDLIYDGDTASHRPVGGYPGLTLAMTSKYKRFFTELS